MQTIKLFQVDSFTDRIFGGNPAAVCPLTEWLDDALLLKIAAENNLSETAFFVGSDGVYRLRWFTPTTEIDLCGHATLAAAHVLFEVLEPGRETVTFASRSGDLTVTKNQRLLTLDFPRGKLVRGEPSPQLIASIGIRPEEYFHGPYHLAVLQTAAEVRSLNPDLEKLRTVPGTGLIVTAPGTQEDFVSRFFAPQIGIPEDPVTGAAHCYLTPYWAERLGKMKLCATQVSARGGQLQCQLQGDRVLISGQARLVIEGNMYVE